MTSKQRAYLMSLASNLNPIFQVGKSSLTPELTAAIGESFNNNELIKIGVLKNCFDDPRAIEGLKAVPRAERHRLREIPEEEAYDQWRLRLAAEAIENAAEQTEEIWQQILEKNGKREEWELEHWDQWLNEIADKNEDAACGEKQEKQAEEELSAFTEQYENAQSAWTDACLFWYDIWCEAHPEPVMDTGTSDTDGSVPQDTESSKTDGSEI